jgi:hypothetical protein
LRLRVAASHAGGKRRHEHEFETRHHRPV